MSQPTPDHPHKDVAAGSEEDAKSSLPHDLATDGLPGGATTRSAAMWTWLNPLALVLGLILLAVTAYLITLSVFLRSSASAYSQGNYDTAIEFAHRFDQFSVFEKHMGPFNEGTALAQKGELEAGEAQLRVALDRTPVRDECTVRQNLAIVLEARGLAAREAGNEDEAQRLLDEGITVSQESPESCRPENSPQDQSQSDDEQRMEEEKDPESQESQQSDPTSDPSASPSESTSEPTDNQSPESSSEPSGSGNSPSDGPSSPGSGDGQSQNPDQDKRDELNRRNNDGQQRFNESNQGSSGKGGVDKPW